MTNAKKPIGSTSPSCGPFLVDVFGLGKDALDDTLVVDLFGAFVSTTEMV